MGDVYGWVKSLHIVFIASWFAGLFYLPRIFVNLAEETDPAVNKRLLLMAKRLYRFMSILAIPATIFGFWLYLGIGIGKGSGWIHAKLFVFVLLGGYHHACSRMLNTFASGRNKHSSKFYRWFNEIPVLLMLIAVLLVVIKPF